MLTRAKWPTPAGPAQASYLCRNENYMWAVGLAVSGARRRSVRRDGCAVLFLCLQTIQGSILVPALPAWP